MEIGVFNRYEKKYLISAKTFLALQDELSEYMTPDPHNRDMDTYRITNIYYDTDDSQFIRNSLAKPAYKEKLRLRAYGRPDYDSIVFMEIKKKFKGMGNKRRSAIKLDEAYRFIETGKMPEIALYMNRQVLCEVAYILERYELSPKLCLSYDRKAYSGERQQDLRVTFDTNILTRRTDLRLESGTYGERLLNENRWVMEIKTGAGMPVWLAHLLSEHKIYPLSFSKYGAEYVRSLTVQAGNGAAVFRPDAEKAGRLVVMPV